MAMTPSTELITALPPDGPLDELLAALTDEGGPTTALVGPDGTQLKMPDEVADALRQVVAAMAQGDAVTIASFGLSQTTMEAADFLDMRWPTVRRLLDAGEIPFERPDEFRRVLLTDLLDYRDRRKASASDDFDRMDTSRAGRGSRLDVCIGIGPGTTYAETTQRKRKGQGA